MQELAVHNLPALTHECEPIDLLAWRMLVRYGNTIHLRPTCGTPDYRSNRAALLAQIDEIISDRWDGRIPASRLDTLQCTDDRIEGRERQLAFQYDIAQVVHHLGLHQSTELFMFPDGFHELAEQLVANSSASQASVDL